jgi:hypothetical protein
MISSFSVTYLFVYFIQSIDNLRFFISDLKQKEEENKGAPIVYTLIYLFRSFPYKMMSTDTVTTLERLANLLRIHSIESTQAANSGLDLYLISIFHSFLFS